LPYRVAVCGVAGRGPCDLLVARLSDGARSAKTKPVFVDLREAPRTPFEELDEMLQDCKAMVICPDPADSTAETLAAVKEGLKAVLASTPPELAKVALVSRIGAQSTKGGFNLGSFFGDGPGESWDGIEDELTSTARTRTSNRPLRYVIVRAGDRPAPGAASAPAQCLPPDSEPEGATTSMEVLAEALFRALALEVNAGFCLVGQDAPPSAAEWSELLLPFVGPEVWRAEVADARKAAIFAKGWAQEFFGAGKRAMRFGVKTPVEIRETPQGVIIKFRPLGSDKDTTFEELYEGGVEFVAEVPPGGGQPRLRARRCAYGWKVVVKENSESALLSKFAQDWAEVAEP